MKRLYQKTTFFLIVLTLIQCLPVSASADQLMSPEQKDQLSEVLYGAELQKELLGLREVDFSQLYISAPVHTYCYMNDRFVDGVELYPIMYGGQTVLFALEDDGRFQITTAMVEVLNEYIIRGVDFCLVYDRNNCYMYTNGEFTILMKSEEAIEERGILDVDGDVLSNMELETARLSGETVLGYRQNLERAETYIGCNVGYVKQDPGTDICWAAAVACIVNYRIKSNLSAMDVVSDYGGGTAGLKDTFIPAVFGKYGLSYSFQETAPSNNVISNNLRQDYPIYGSFIVNTDSRHSAVIYGINVVGGYIYIMDPLIGFTSATMQNGKYAYVNPTNISVLTLDRAVCHSW